MARIAGVDLPKNKRIEIALTYIFGIGSTSAHSILEDSKVEVGKNTNDLTETEVSSIRAIIDQKYKVEGDLKRQIQMNIKRLMDLGSYKGLRHRRGLPVNGQRTKTNARTRKGPKRTYSKKN